MENNDQNQSTKNREFINKTKPSNPNIRKPGNVKKKSNGFSQRKYMVYNAFENGIFSLLSEDDSERSERLKQSRQSKQSERLGDCYQYILPESKMCISP